MIRPPWTPEQDALVREHFLRASGELHAMVNTAGPERTLSAVVTRRAALGCLKCPRPRGSAKRMADIAKAVANDHGLTLDQLRGPKRDRPINRARRQAMAEAYATGGFSYITIGQFFGGRDHTTALHAVKKFLDLAKQEAAA